MTTNSTSTTGNGRIRLQQCEAIIGTMKTPRRCKRKERVLRKPSAWGKFFCRRHKEYAERNHMETRSDLDVNSALAELRERFIRPDHEFTPAFQLAKTMAGSVMLPWRCSSCLEYHIVNNVCSNCGRDDRLRYGDFERTMTESEWANVRANCGDSLGVREFKEQSKA